MRECTGKYMEIWQDESSSSLLPMLRGSYRRHNSIHDVPSGLKSDCLLSEPPVSIQVNEKSFDLKEGI